MKMLYLACIKHSAVIGCHSFCLEKKKNKPQSQNPEFHHTHKKCVLKVTALSQLHIPSLKPEIKDQDKPQL